MGVSESPPLVVKQGGLVLPLCPSGWHGLETVNAFMEAGVDHLLKAINKAHIAKPRDGSVDLELSDQLLHRAVTLAQGGELPPGCGLAGPACKPPLQFF